MPVPIVAKVDVIVPPVSQVALAVESVALVTVPSVTLAVCETSMFIEPLVIKVAVPIVAWLIVVALASDMVVPLSDMAESWTWFWPLTTPLYLGT
jgi:hypothetical protein